MNKGILSLLCISLIVAAQCESFMRIPFENGRVSSRSLAELNKAAFTTLHPNNTAVAVTLPDNFKTLNADKIKADTVTDFLVLIYQSYSGVFNGYDKDFVSLTCNTDVCANQAGINWMNGHPWFRVGGYISNIKMQVKSGDAVAWELQDKLALYTTSSTSSGTQQYADYVKSPGAFGFIGLGTNNGADKNFKSGDSPIFSIKTSRTRTGSIIFGNDGSSTKNPQKLTADKNWRVSWDSFKIADQKGTVSTGNIGLISFDVNTDGIIVNADFNPMMLLKNGVYPLFTYETEAAKKPFGIYDYSYTGSISSLPDLIINSGDKQILKIPATQYMRWDETTKKFALLITAKGSYSDDMTSKTVSPIILGNQFMAQYYTVFEQTKDGNFVTLNEAPLNDWPSGSGSSSGGGKGWIIGVVAVVGLAAVGYIVFKNKAANKLSEHLNPK